MGRLHCHGSNRQINSTPHTNTQETCKKKKKKPQIHTPNFHQIRVCEDIMAAWLFSHKTTHELASYYGSIRQWRIHPDAMPESVCLWCVKRNITLLYLYAGCVYIYTGQTEILLNTQVCTRRTWVWSSVVICVCVCTYSVRSLGMWLKLDRGMRVMLLLLRVLDGSKEKANRKMWRKEIIFYCIFIIAFCIFYLTAVRKSTSSWFYIYQINIKYW